MGKTLKYVKEFEFPSDKGYSASSGQTMVKGYARGGSCNMAKGGMAEGGKMDRLKSAIGNERKEIARVEDKRRDAGQEISRVRSEMRYDKNEMKGMRKQYPTDRREPMVGPMAAMAKGGMLYSKKEVNAKNLLREGKAPALPHAKRGVNMAKGGHVSKKIMKKFDGGYIQNPASSGVPQAVSPLTQIANPQAQAALQNMISPGNTSLSPTAMKRGGKVRAKLVKMANGGALPPGAAGGALPPGMRDNSPDPQMAIDRAFLKSVQRPPSMQPQKQSPLSQAQMQALQQEMEQENQNVMKMKQNQLAEQQQIVAKANMEQKPQIYGGQARVVPKMANLPQQPVRSTAQNNVEQLLARPRMPLTAQEAAGRPVQFSQRDWESMSSAGRANAMRNAADIARSRANLNNPQSRPMPMPPKPGGTFQADLGRPDMPVLRGNDGNGNPMGVAANRPMVDSQGRPPPQTVTQVTPIKVPANVTNTYTPGGLGSAQMGRPSGPVNTGGLGQGGLPSYMTTSQSNIMGGDRRPAGGFNLANMQQGLQQLAARNNPQQMGRPGMAKGGLTSKQQGKVGKVMGEFKAGDLHSGSKSGPVVKSRKQAIAIGLSEARKAKK